MVLMVECVVRGDWWWNLAVGVSSDGGEWWSDGKSWKEKTSERGMREMREKLCRESLE